MFQEPSKEKSHFVAVFSKGNKKHVLSVSFELLERLSMMFTANDKRYDKIFFLPKQGET